MKDNRNEVRAIADAIDAKKAEAATEWAEFTSARDEARKEGVDSATNAEAFDKIDALAKAHDEVRNEVAKLGGPPLQDARLVRRRPAPVSRRDMADRKEHVLSVAKKVLDSDQYAALKASGALDNRDVMFGSTGAIKALSRAELKTLITSGWFQRR